MTLQYIYQVILLTLTLYNVIWQFYLNNIGEK